MISQSLANLAFKRKDNKTALMQLLSPYKRQTLFFYFWLQNTLTTNTGEKYRIIEIVKSIFPDIENDLQKLKQTAPNLFYDFPEVV